MENITIMEALGLSAVAIIVVMIVLVGLMVIVNGFKYISGSEQVTVASIPQPATSPAPAVLEEDDETKTVAALTALIMANDNQQDKKYRITSIKRIK
ncbi:OadG family protein [Streptococcus rifensis]